MMPEKEKFNLLIADLIDKWVKTHTDLITDQNSQQQRKLVLQVIDDLHDLFKEVNNKNL